MEQNSVIDFLIENSVENLTKEVIVSERLKDYPFTIKAMTGPEFNQYRSVATAVGKKANIKFDEKKYQEQVVLNQVISPSFRNQENIQRAGLTTPEAFLYKSLLSGEIAELVNQIASFSGFDLDEKELVEEVKKD